MMSEISRYTIALLVDNDPGVLSRVSRLFSGKGYNIHSLTMGAIQNPSVARITIETNSDEQQIQVICNQLGKLICVHSVKLMPVDQTVRMKMMLIKVDIPTPDIRSEIEKIAGQFLAALVDESDGTATIAFIGDESEINSIHNLLSGFDILEIVSTGIIAIEKGASTIDEQTKEKEEFDYAKNVLSL
jgi:acetolactate synthase-1/3 small subunit